MAARPDHLGQGDASGRTVRSWQLALGVVIAMMMFVALSPMLRRRRPPKLLITNPTLGKILVGQAVVGLLLVWVLIVLVIFGSRATHP
jgi:hypothetical protein